MRKRKIIIAFFIFLILPIIIGLRLDSFHWSGGRDTGIFVYIGDMILQGQIPYRDIWEHKTPLIYYLNAFLFRLFGSQMRIIPIFEIFWLLVCCIFIYQLSNLIFKREVSLFVCLVSAIYLSTIKIIESFGMTETYSVLPAVIAVFGVIKYKMTSKKIFIFISGLMSALAILFRPSAAIVVLPIILYLAIETIYTKQRFWYLFTAYLIFILGASIPLAAFSIYFFVNGALEDCLSQLFNYNLEYSKGITVYFFQSIKKLIYVTFITVFGRWPLLICFGMAGILYKLFDFSKEVKNRTLRLNLHEYSLFFMLLFWFWSGLYAVAFSGRFYRHYYVEVVPSLALLSGYTVEYLIKQFKSPLRLISLIVVLCLFSTPLFCDTYSAIAILKNRNVFLNDSNSVEIDGFRYEYQRPELVRWIMENTSEEDFVYFWGAEAGLNFLTKRKSPTRYIILYSLQRPGYTKDSDLQMFIKDLKENKPKFIIDTGSTNRRIPSLDLKGSKPREQFFYYDWKLLLPAIKFINENYAYERTINEWAIYRQR